MQVTDAVGGYPSKKTAVQCRVQKAHAIQFAVNGIAGCQARFLERNISQGTVVEMGVCDRCIKERGVLYGAALKFGAKNAYPVKGGLPDPAHGKGAVAESGEIKIRVVGYAVERYPVKVGFAEKIRGKPCLGRAVIKAAG